MVRVHYNVPPEKKKAAVRVHYSTQPEKKKKVAVRAHKAKVRAFYHANSEEKKQAVRVAYNAQSAKGKAMFKVYHKANCSARLKYFRKYHCCTKRKPVKAMYRLAQPTLLVIDQYVNTVKASLRANTEAMYQLKET